MSDCEGSFVAGLNSGSPTSGDKSLQDGRPTLQVLKMWRFVMLPLLLVLGSRSRFTNGLLIAGDILDANDMLATIQRLRHFGAARGATPSLPRVHLSHKVRSGPITWCPMCGAYSLNRSFALRQCCPGSSAWLLHETQPLEEVLSEHCCSCVGIDIPRSRKETNKSSTTTTTSTTSVAILAQA